MKNVFLIYLRGGGQCYDSASCSQRWIDSPSLMSSKYFSKTIEYSGVMDMNPAISPSFWGANKFALAYCSSDGYMGDMAASNETFNFHFRGQRLVFELIRVLIRDHGLNSESQILFAGGSAGARGAMTLIDLLVAEHLPIDSKVVALLDSPFYLDFSPYNQSFPGFAYQEQQKYNLINTKAVLSEDCLRQYPQDGWKCQFGEYRMPFVRTPYFLIASQDDSYQLYYNTGENVPPYPTPAMEEYGASFAARTQELIRALSARCSTAATSERPLIYGELLNFYVC